MHLSEIWIYPVKSLGGISLPSARIAEKGLLHDRRWMLVDENGVFMTQRWVPKMALFKVSMAGTFDSAEFRVVHGSDTITLPARPEGFGERATIWDDTVTVVEPSAEHSAWFSEHLSMNCRLVYFPESHARPVDPQYSFNDEHVSLADAYPFLIIGQSSLNDLNDRLEHPLPMNRFRPNLVFTGGLPYEEDRWREFSIGNNRFVGVKPCARCILTTINQDTAEQGKEPLRTLARYRSRNNKIYFGQNAVAVDHGEIKKGDEINIG